MLSKKIKIVPTANGGWRIEVVEIYILDKEI
jgi:hypothetical protein